LRQSSSKKQYKYAAAAGLVGGLLLFCAPLYYMAVNGRNEEMKYMMPVGGISFIAGWLAAMLC
jgi:uncharacterized membrane protein YgdD (TMEM256/DUF423 family)